MAKTKYIELISLLILLSLICVSSKKYEKSNLKQFLSKLGLPDIPSSYQFLEENDDQESPIDYENPKLLKEEEPIKNDTEEDDYDYSDISNESEYENETEEEDEKKDDQKEEDDTHEEEETTPEEEEEEEKTIINIKCLWVQKYNVYSLQKLQDKKNDYEKEFKEGKVIFNFCQNTNQYKNNIVIWEKNTTNETKEIIKAAGSIEGEKNSKNEWDELNDDEENSGLLIKLTRGEKCKGDKYHQTYFKIYCDPDAEDDEFEESIDVEEFSDIDYPCKHYIKVKSIYGCALNDWYLLRRIMKEKKILFFLGFLAIGLFLCLWGKKFKTPTILITLGIICCYAVTIIVLNFVPSLIKTEKSLWILLGIGFLIGVVIGYLIKAKVKAFTITLGISMGYSIAEFVYQFLQGFIEWNPQYLYYGTIGVCCVAGILVGFFVVDAIIIIGTSLIGGYIAMRGVSTLFGNYIDEGQFVDLIKNGEYEQLKELRSGWVYAYLGIWIILTIFGIYYQCIGHKKDSSSSSNSTDYQKQEK